MSGSGIWSGSISGIFSRRSLIVAAHPDDEVIGLGGHLSRFRGLIIHVTDGAPENDTAGFTTKKEYADARRRELFAAVELSGISRDRCVTFDISDQKAMFFLKDLTLRIATLVEDWKPSIIFTHPYEGGHPDHDSCAFAVNSAMKLLRKRRADKSMVMEFTSYHRGPSGMETGFLPNSISPVHIFHLSEEQVALKRRMAECFVTQEHMIRRFPTDVEQVREAPDYDFSQPPQSGTLLYESFNWGICGSQWRTLAGEAKQSLGI